MDTVLMGIMGKLTRIFGLGVVWAATAATTFIERPFPMSVKDAPVIVHGTVGNAYTDWGHERGGGKRIFTFWELRVVEVLKGDAESDLLRMREMGGEKDGRGMQVAGAASFDTGEDVVVFLDEKNAEGSYDIYGMSMGKFDLQKEADGQEVLVGPGINNLTPHRVGVGEHESSGSKPKWTLAELRRLLASQGSVVSHSDSRDTSRPAARPVSAPSVTPPSQPVAAAPAPGLQFSDSKEPSFPYGWALVAAGSAFALALMLTRKRK